MKEKTCWSIAVVVLLISTFACNSLTTGSSPTAAAQTISPTVTAQAASSTSAAEPAPPSTIMTPGDHKQTITSGGVERPYTLHVPGGYDGSTPLPLVFILHGYGGNAASMVKSTGMNEKADQESFFAAYLNGTGNPQGWVSGLTPELNLTADDVQFIRDLITELGKLVYLDDSRVYAAGFSNGAFMTHRLGAELSDLLAGIAVVEGTIGLTQADGSLLTTPDPMGPIPVLIIHGEKDPNVKYDGGKGAGRLDALSVADAIAFWTKTDGCSGTPQHTSTAELITDDYQACAAGTEVLVYSTVNGVHQWPSLDNAAKFSGTDAVLDFFSKHHK